MIETDSCQFQEVDRAFEMFQEMKEKHHQGTWERSINGCVLLSLYHYAFMLAGCGYKWDKPEQTRTSELNCLFALNLTSHCFSYVYHIPVPFKDHMTSHDSTLQLAWQPTTHF